MSKLEGPKTVGIIGAKGFVGKHLSNVLIGKGYKVIQFSRATNGDFTKINNWGDLLKECDFVVHLAGIAHLDLSLLSEEDYQKNNVELSKNIGIACLNLGIKRLIFLSTIKVNGEGQETFYEESSQENPEDIYGLSKLRAERELIKLFRNNTDQLVILRPPLIYGSGVKANMKAILKLASFWIPLPFGNFKSKKSFLFVENLTSVIERLTEVKSLKSQVYLISDDDDQTLSSMISTVRSIYGIPPMIFSLPFDWIKLALLILPTKRQAFKKLNKPLFLTSKKIQRDLNWVPPFTFKQGISKTIERS